MASRKNLILSARILFLALIYFVTGKFGLEYALNHFATIIWAPSGLAVAAVLIFGYRMWPGIFLGAFAVNFTSGAPLIAALGVAGGNTLEALLGCFLCFQLKGFNISLPRRRDAMHFVFAAAVLSPLVAAIIGCLSLYLGSALASGQMVLTGVQWWAGDCIGILTVAPLFLMFRTLPARSEFTIKRVAEGLVVASAIFVILAVFFVDYFAELAGYRVKGAFLYPFLMWASIRFGVRGAVLATLVVSATTIWATTHGLGPFAVQSVPVQSVQVSIFVISWALINLIVAAVVAELQQSRRALSRALSARDLFFSMASHELKTPITSLKLQFQLLERDIVEDRPPKQALSEIVTSSLRQVGSLQDLVDDLLDVSRIRTGRFTLQLEKVNLSEMIRQTCARFTGQLARAKLDLRLELEPEVLGRWDRRRIEQVLINLLSNALKYASPGPLTIRAFARGGEAMVIVEDTGPGISFDQQERIFERFERLDPSNAADGLGLGLYIVKEIVDAHHGNVGLVSAVGKGSQFSITLPSQPV